MKKKRNSEATTPYSSINDSFDKLISIYGSTHTSHILKAIIDNPDFYLKVKKVDMEILSCIISCTLQVFEIARKKDFISGKTGQFSSSRHSCFYLIKKYTKCSDKQIAGYLSNGNTQISRASVQAGRSRVQDVLNDPRIDESFYEKHMQLEKNVREYIEKNNLIQQ